MQTRAEQLSCVAYFANCGAAAMDEIASVASDRRVSAGQRIVTQGEPGEGLFIVLEGKVKLFKLSAEGREQILLVLGPGRTFNDVAAFDGGASPANAEALVDSVVAAIAAPALRRLAERHPAIALAATRVLAARLRTMTLMVENLAFRDVTGRVASIIKGCAAHDQPMIEGVPRACATITQRELAAMTGSVREVVQRSLKTLEQAGAIRLARARIEIVDVEALDDWLLADG